METKRSWRGSLVDQLLSSSSVEILISNPTYWVVVSVHWRSRTVDVVCVRTGTWLRGPSPGSLSWRPGPVQPWTWENEGRDNNTPTLWPTLHNNTSLLSFNPVCPRIVTKMTERRLARGSCRLGLTRRMLNEAESLHPSDPASLPPRIINQELSTLGN